MPEFKNLPIYEVEKEICSSLEKENRLILQAPTGSGKSTQVPQILLDKKLITNGQIVVLQPRRIAARMLASRVSFERQTKLGAETGYQIRFENQTSEETKIRFVTEAILLRQIVSDPNLTNVSTIIFDEFHERHLHGDITLARALHVQQTTRPDLKLIVMSATLNPGPLEEFLNPCQTIQSAGRTYPVTTEYWKRSISSQTTPVWDAATEAFESWNAQGNSGDVLIFMPGNFEIQKTIQSLQVSHAASNHLILPLHGELPSEQQDNAVAPQDKPKIIVSTNVAETSLTIDGIKLVIDSGLARIADYDPVRGINTLHIHKISQSSADQRKGRAGRTSEGHCIRLWKEKDHSFRPLSEKPEIHRLDLSEVLLNLKCSGVRDLEIFNWFDRPDEQSLNNALTLLCDLGAFDKDHELTPLGRKMQSFPTHPRYARLLLAAAEFDCVNQACLIAALTQGRDILISRVDKFTRERREDILGTSVSSDFFLSMRAWRFALAKRFQTRDCKQLGIHAGSARLVQPLFNQFIRIAKQLNLDTEPHKVPDENIRRSLLLAFSDRLAIRLDRGTTRCQMVHKRRGNISKDSCIQNSGLIVAAEINEIEGRDKTVQTFLSNLTEIEEDWLLQHFPEDIHTGEEVELDPQTKRVRSFKQTFFRDLLIKSEDGGEASDEAKAKLLALNILDGNIPLKNWDPKIENWITRVNVVSQACPELDIPRIDEDAKLQILTQICMSIRSPKDLKEVDVNSHVKDWLSSSQVSLVDKHAPEKVLLKNGKRVRVEYKENEDPVLSARIQDLLGISILPSILLGNRSPVIHILAPNFRPVQVTKDLESFWNEHYPSRKKELQRKYPKHAWPDDPLILEKK